MTASFSLSLQAAYRSLFRASKWYWIIQGVTLSLGLLSGIVMSQAGGATSPDQVGRAVLRGAIGAMVFFTTTHVGIRAVLHGFFGLHGLRLRQWLLLLLWLVVLVNLVYWLNVAINSVVMPNGGKEIASLQLKENAEQIPIKLQGVSLYIYLIANMFGTYAIWTGLYLAYQALKWRRSLQQKANHARLVQLTHQLNPHFLFNALNTIRGTIFEDKEKAAELVTELSELFRFHLNLSDQFTQTLAEDWQLAKRYLALEQARLENRLRVKFEIAEDCMPRRLPALSVLGLIENAVKHGVAPNPDGGEVQVQAGSHGQGWRLTVRNSVGPHTSNLSTKVGLKNLRERLRLGFGPAANLNVSHENGWHSVQIDLPMEGAA